MAHYDGSMTCCAIRLETVEQKQTKKQQHYAVAEDAKSFLEWPGEQELYKACRRTRLGSMVWK